MLELTFKQVDCELLMTPLTKECLSHLDNVETISLGELKLYQGEAKAGPKPWEEKSSECLHSALSVFWSYSVAQMDTDDPVDASHRTVLEDTTLPKVFALLDYFSYGYDLFHHPATGICDCDNSAAMVAMRRAAARAFLTTLPAKAIVINWLTRESLTICCNLSEQALPKRRAVGEAAWEWNRHYFPRPDLVLQDEDYQVKEFRRLAGKFGSIRLGWG